MAGPTKGSEWARKIAAALKNKAAAGGQKLGQIGNSLASSKIGSAVASGAAKVNSVTNKANDAINSSVSKGASKLASTKAAGAVKSAASSVGSAVNAAHMSVAKKATERLVNGKPAAAKAMLKLRKGIDASKSRAATAGRVTSAVAKSRSGKVAIVAGGAMAANAAMKKRNTVSAKVKRAVGMK